MAIVKFHCNSGANIYSCRTAILDTVKDLGLEENEFESLSEKDQYKIVQEWANDRLEIYWEYA